MRGRQGLYIISVAANIVEMHPQTLRKYERAGFLEPPRLGTLRLYSDEDLARLRLIKYLVEDLGLNIAGVQLALGVASKLLSIRELLLSQEKGKALQEIDSILETLGIADRQTRQETGPEQA